MTNLNSVLKSRDNALPTKVHIVKALIFPVVMYGCESWTIRKAECQRIDASEPWCWRRLLTISWTARRSNQSILKEINPEYSLEGRILKLKLQYFGHLMGRTDLLELGCWEILKEKGEGSAEDEMVRWGHWFNEHKFEQTSGDSKGQGGLACVLPFMGSRRVRPDLVTEQQHSCIPGSSLLWDRWRFACAAYFFLHVRLLLSIFRSFFFFFWWGQGMNTNA